MNTITTLELHKAIANNRVKLIIGNKVFVPDDIEIDNDPFKEGTITVRTHTSPLFYNSEEWKRVRNNTLNNNRWYQSCSDGFSGLRIKDVIFNDPATIVFWSDGTKTVVKAQYNEMFDPEKGLAMAISKKTLGNKGNYYKEFDKWLPEETQDDSDPIDELVAFCAGIQKMTKEARQQLHFAECKTCKYRDVIVGDYRDPCMTCDNGDHWKSREEKNE